MPVSQSGHDPRQRLSPRALALARLAWLALLAATLALFVAGLAVYARQLQVVCPAPPCYPSPTPASVQALHAAGLSVGVAAALKVAAVGLNALVHALVAAVILWRLPADRLASFTALTLLIFGLFGVHDTVLVTAILAALPPLWQLPVYLLHFAGSVSIAVFYFVFPDGRFVPRWLRWPVSGWVAWQAGVVLFPNSPLSYTQWPVPVMLLYWGLFFVTLLAAQFYRYRRVSNAVQRQQTKWAVFGMALALTLALAAAVLTASGPALGPRWAALAFFQDVGYYPFVLLVPLSIGVAILRSRLYDIDVVINRALVYSVLTALLTLAYLGSVLVLQSASRVLTGSRPNQLVTVLSTLLIAALFVPLRARVQRAIDWRFYRLKYDAVRTLSRFAVSMRDETNLARLTDQLVGVVQETMQPATVSLWLRAGQAQPPADPAPHPPSHAPRAP